MSATRASAQASVLAVLSAMALVVLDAGMINVALPTISTSLKVSPADAILAVSAYQTALLIGLLPCAHLAGQLGYRRLFVGGLALYSLASIACALAVDLPMLVAARAIQGFGGAAILALGIALLRLALGGEQLGRAIGWNALTVALCSAAAPIAGALMLSLGPWPWLFLAKLPVGAVALVAARSLPEAALDRHRIDIPGIALHALVAALVFVAAGVAIRHPGPAALLASTAIVLAVALVRRQRSSEAPVWPVDLLALRPFRISVIASVCCFTAQSTGLLALPFQVQLSLGRGPLVIGLVLACWPLTVAVTSTAASRLALRFGSATLCAIGGAVLGSGLLLSAAPAAGIAPLAIGAVLSGLGFGLFQVPNNRTLFLTAPADRGAAAGGMQGTARLAGQTLGALLTGFLFASAPAMIAPRIGFALASMFAIAAALVSALETAFAARIWRSVAAPGSRFL